MNTRAEEGGRNFWQNAIKEQVASGLSIKEYCEVIEKSRYQFYYWRQRMQGKRLKATAPLCSAVDFIEMNTQVMIPKAVRCVEVRIGAFSLNYTSDTDQELFCKAATILLALRNEQGVAG